MVRDVVTRQVCLWPAPPPRCAAGPGWLQALLKALAREPCERPCDMPCCSAALMLCALCAPSPAQVVAHFRAHASALAALAFSPDGTMLATASVAGHNINVFRIVPPAAPVASAAALTSSAAGAAGLAGLGSGGPGGDALAAAGAAAARGAQQSGYAVHLLRLHRGVTSATIQSISFAPDASWAAVTSHRGTSHVFHLGLAACGAAGAAAAGPAGGAGAAWAAVGAAGQPLQLDEGVAGRPVRLVAAGRGGGRSGIVGAAAQAARSVYGQSAGGPALGTLAYLPLQA